MQELCLSVLLQIYAHLHMLSAARGHDTNFLLCSFLLKIALLIVTPTSLHYQISLQPYKITEPICKHKTNAEVLSWLHKFSYKTLYYADEFNTLQHGFLGLSAKDNNNDLCKLYSTEGNTLVYFMSILGEAQQEPLQLTTTIREDNSAWPIYVIENESVITEL